MQRLLNEPLLYFVVAGAGIFALGEFVANDDENYIIEVTDAERARLKDQWQAQTDRAPAERELDGLIEKWIREEIYYREALRMGLDRDDIIIRRRLAQKLNFLTEDVATTATPSAEALQAYFRENGDRYQLPERFSFRHRYFSTERRANAKLDATAALGDETMDGDPSLLQLTYVERTEQDIAHLFGTEFAAALKKLPEDGWQGPIRSAYGWHLVTIEKRTRSRMPSFDEVAGEVALDHQNYLRRLANERYYETLRSRYEITGL